MNRQVWKFPLAGDVMVPVGAKVVHVGLDPNGISSIWLEVVPDSETELRSFRIFGTGHEVWEGATHVGSFNDGPFMWHVYEC